jgi:hypothetical protein
MDVFVTVMPIIDTDNGNVITTNWIDQVAAGVHGIQYVPEPMANFLTVSYNSVSISLSFDTEFCVQFISSNIM